jgi:hypothetical protein
MPKDIKPVVPVENEEPVEQAPVANLEAPVVEAADPQEVLEEVSSGIDELLANTAIEPSIADKLRDAFAADLSDILNNFDLPKPIEWDRVVGIKLKDGVSAKQRHRELEVPRMYSIYGAKALVASGLYDVILKED